MGQAGQRLGVVLQLGQQPVECLRQVADLVVAHHPQRCEREFAARHPVGLVGGAQQRAQQPGHDQADHDQHRRYRGRALLQDEGLHAPHRRQCLRHRQPRHHEPAAGRHRRDGGDFLDAPGVAGRSAAAVAGHGPVVQGIHALGRGGRERHADVRGGHEDPVARRHHQDAPVLAHAPALQVVEQAVGRKVRGTHQHGAHPAGGVAQRHGHGQHRVPGGGCPGPAQRRLPVARGLEFRIVRCELARAVETPAGGVGNLQADREEGAEGAAFFQPGPQPLGPGQELGRQRGGQALEEREALAQVVVDIARHVVGQGRLLHRHRPGQVFPQEAGELGVTGGGPQHGHQQTHHEQANNQTVGRFSEVHAGGGVVERMLRTVNELLHLLPEPSAPP